MTRAPLNYSNPGRELAVGGFDPDQPEPGFYRMRLRRGSVFSAIRIWFGAPLDPVTGEEMDRGHRWNAEINGRPAEIDQVWPRCAGQQVTEAEHAYLISRQEWGRQFDPNGPDANPHKPADPLSAPIPF